MASIPSPRFFRWLLVLFGIGAAVAWRPVGAQTAEIGDFDECYMQCHMDAMWYYWMHGLENATGWFHWCMEENCGVDM